MMLCLIQVMRFAVSGYACVNEIGLNGGSKNEGSNQGKGSQTPNTPTNTSGLTGKIDFTVMVEQMR
jgi:hypothetical protein